MTSTFTLSDFPVVIDESVAWAEMDAYQHVNNATYFRYFESARIAYFEQIGFGTINLGVIGPILKSTSCTYRIPLTYPSKIKIGAKVQKVESDRFSMRYVVWSMTHGQIAAEGEGVVVCFDYGKNEKTPLPENILQAIQALESKNS